MASFQEGAYTMNGNREYVKIYVCADCIYYDIKNHKCRLGAHDEGTGHEYFFRDCPLGIYEEEKSEPYDNPPVDYSQLEIGKPYWIEVDYGAYVHGSFEIPADNRANDYGEYLLMQSGKKLWRFDASWIAYRKERK